MSPYRFGSGTLVVREGVNTYLIWCWGHAPQGVPADFTRLEPMLAANAMQRWLRDGSLGRHHQADLYRTCNPSASLLNRVGTTAMSGYLLDRTLAGHLNVSCLSESISMRGDSAAPATVLDKPPPTPVPIGHTVARKPANQLTGAPEQDVPVAVFAGTGYAPKAGLPNLTDATCPSPNHRSESTATCSPEVNQWFVKKQVPVPRRDESLGIDGGGGFLRSKTTVKHLSAGTLLYRYVDSATWPWGGWWFLKPLSGNPCVEAALPETSAASVMVQARLKTSIDVLYGPGAPRCSNKPGGPEQVLIAHCDFNPATGDVLDIVS